MIKIAPSILSADFMKLGSEIKEIRAAGADYIHYDVMDGAFVPNISLGIDILKSIRKNTDMIIDAHLMIDRPLRYAEEFCKAGADIVTLHWESDSPEEISKAIDVIKKCGKKVGLAIKPATPASAVYPFLECIDMVLVMTVEPGFSGQKFMIDQLPKIKEIREKIDSLQLACDLEVDGGINVFTARLVKEAGANVLVSASAIFGQTNRAAQIDFLRNA